MEEVWNDGRKDGKNMGVGGSITKTSIERVKDGVDIVELIGGYMPLKRAGANFVGLCPFHQEKSPSFNVSPSRQMFHCFGCQKGGDAVGFVMDYEGLAFVEAIEKLARRIGVELEYEEGFRGGGSTNRSEKEQLYNVHERVTEWWHALLMNDATGEGARHYLKQRGVDWEFVKAFRLGFSPEKWDEVLSWGKSKGYDSELLMKAGIVKRHEESGRYYCRFRGRLMFPITDMQGRVIGFSGRILKEDEKGAKYINSPETDIFKKAQVLFGLDKARKAILDSGFTLICEGQLDTIALHQAGFKNVVAPQGTSFGDGHIRALKRLSKQLVLCFDSDGAGKKAAARVWKDLLKYEMEASVVNIPAGHDPDSFLQEFGNQGFEELLNGRQNYFDYLISHWSEGLDVRTSAGKREVAFKMGEVAASCPDPIMLTDIARKTAMAIGERAELIHQAWAKQKSKMASRPTSNQDAPPPPDVIPGEFQEPQIPIWDIAAVPKNELELLRVLLGHPEKSFCESNRDRIPVEWLTDTGITAIIATWQQSILQCQSNLREESRESGDQPANWESRLTESFFEGLKDTAYEKYCRQTMLKLAGIISPERQLDDILTKLRNAYLDRRILELTEQASREGATKEEIGIALRLQQKLRDEKRTPLEESFSSEADYF